MARLENYTQFAGRAPVSASIRNALDYQGVVAPHSGKPYSEALLAGVAGGICFGYFTFHYEGHNPQVNILTRNSFHNYGWDAIVSRLRMEQKVINSTTPEKAEAKLIESLEGGKVPIVLADVFTLGYEHSEFGEGMWAMQPMVVCEYDRDNDRASTADRAICAHSIPASLLREARERVKKVRCRMTIVSPPDADYLQAAVREGLRETVSLFTEKPPKGSANNFGFKAYEAIVGDLRAAKGKKAWSRQFSGGAGVSSALLTAYKHSQLFWKDGSEGADRLLFSDFLVEAADILEDRAVLGAAELFGKAAGLWKKLGGLLLPGDVPGLGLAKLRGLMDERNKVFVSQGIAGLTELRALDREMAEAVAAAELPGEAALAGVYEAVAAGFEEIAKVEHEAVVLLGEIVAAAP